jgi:hypothetical protein
MKLKKIPVRGTTGKLRKAIDWLNKYRNDRKKFDNTQPFDFPDYWNLPRSLIEGNDGLSSDAVDYIQEHTYDWVDTSLDEQEEQEAEEIQNAIDLLKEHCYTVYDPNGKDLTGD